MNSERWRSRFVCFVAWLALLTCWSPSGFAIDGVPTPDAVDSGSAKPALRSTTSFKAVLSEIIYQNTPGNSEGYPLGLPWNKGFYGTRTLKPAPAGFSAVTGWGVVYPKTGAPVLSLLVSGGIAGLIYQLLF